MNDDESFKLGIVLSYLKQYDANKYYYHFIKGKFAQFKCLMH